MGTAEADTQVPAAHAIDATEGLEVTEEAPEAEEEDEQGYVLEEEEKPSEAPAFVEGEEEPEPFRGEQPEEEF